MGDSEITPEESDMGFYDERILPHLIEFTCGMPALGPMRERTCEGLAGEVVELGFGSGLNVGRYPDSVTRITAIEPSDGGWRLAQERVAGSKVPIDRGGLDGQRLPFDDNTFDAALSTFTLCTIPDLAVALAEVRRVVKPDGTLHFLEHGHAPDPSVARWQRRFTPIQKRVGGGCHLDRDIAGSLTAAGLRVTALEQFYSPGTPKIFGAMNLGVAHVD